MLIDSPRLTDADRDAWETLERYDANPAMRARVDRLADRALQVIGALRQPWYVSTSWGKDSTVVVDLAAQVNPTVRVLWIRVDGADLPECEQVRDTMLARYPQLTYAELTAPKQPGRWWDEPGQRVGKYQASLGWRLANAWGGHYVSGIRAEESRLRDMVMATRGVTSANSSRPIGQWTAIDVFAYLHGRDLPVHPAYAMSYGGAKDRRWLRVHSLGGVTGAHRDRADWEQHYYGDIIHSYRYGPRTVTEYTWTRLPNP